MTTQDIMKLTPGQLRKMDRSELATKVSALASAANKRLRNFEKSNIETTAVKNVRRTGGDFSVKGKNVTELIQEHKRATRFLQSKTGNLRQGAAKEQRVRIQREKKKPEERTLTTKRLIDSTSRDIAARSDEQLRKDIKHLADTANKRINALGKAGEESKALTNALEGGGFFGVNDGASREEIVAELARIKTFLDDKGSTVSGAQRIRKKLEKRLNTTLTKQDVKGLWGVYNKVTEKYPALVRRFSSTAVQKMIAQRFSRMKDVKTDRGFEKRKEKILSAVEQLMRTAYEEEQEAHDDISRGDNTFYDVTNPFEDGDNISAKRRF